MLYRDSIVYPRTLPFNFHLSLLPFMCRFSEKALAKMFRIRQQRVMAIIALKQMEADAEASGFLNAGEEDEFQILMETEVFDCIESQGVGERHVVTSASFPVQQVSDSRFTDLNWTVDPSQRSIYRTLTSSVPVGCEEIVPIRNILKKLRHQRTSFLMSSEHAV